MKGAIIGEVVGSSYRDKNTFIYNFPLLTSESTFSNTTAYSVSLTESLLQEKPFVKIPEMVNILTVLPTIGLLNVSPQKAFDYVRKITPDISISHAIAYTIVLRRLKKYKNKGLVSSTLIESLGKDWVKSIPKLGERTDKVKDILPLSAYLFLLSNTFEDCLRLAVSYGGYSSVLAPVVCGIAESFYGVPDNLWVMIKKLLPESMIQTIDQFYNTLY